jgi:hypothetical protein
VNCALAFVPAPRLPADQPVTDAERGAAVHDVATAINSSIVYLTEGDRRELAAALLAGLSVELDMTPFVPPAAR